MQKFAFILVASVALAAVPARAAEYACARKETGTKLNDYAISIGDREAAIKEMREEIKDGGGATDQQKKALAGFEEKLAKAKSDRDALLKTCNAN